MRLAHHYSHCYSTDAFAGVHSPLKTNLFRSLRCFMLERILKCLGFDLMPGIMLDETCFLRLIPDVFTRLCTRNRSKVDILRVVHSGLIT